MATRSPDDGVVDVGRVAAAATEYTHRQHPGVVGDTGAADTVVGDFGDGACHVRAMPAAVAGRRTGAALVGGTVVTEVPAAGDAAVIVPVRDERVGNEVITGQQVGLEVGVVGGAGVDHSYDHPRAGRTGFPCGGNPRPARPGTVVPHLVAAEHRVIGHGGGMHQPVDPYRFDIGLRGNGAHQGFGLAAVQSLRSTYHVLAAVGGPQGLYLQGGCALLRGNTRAQLRAGTAGSRVQGTLAGRRLGALGRAGLVGHDETWRQRCVIDGGKIDGACKCRSAGAGHQQAQDGTTEIHGWIPGMRSLGMGITGQRRSRGRQSGRRC